MSTWFLALTGFAIAASITPGPNNVMVTANAAQNGLRATLPHMFGIALGFALMIAAVGIGLAGTILANPVLARVMRVGSLAWLVVLAWNIARAGVPQHGAAATRFGFGRAMLFQWVNPKAWMIALTIAAAWIDPAAATTPQILLIAGVFLAVGPPSTLPWALLGTGANRLLRTPGQWRAFNIAMAVLLLASMAPLVLA